MAGSKGKKDRPGKKNRAQSPSASPSVALYAGLVAGVAVLAYLGLQQRNTAPKMTAAEAAFRKSLGAGADSYKLFFSCEDGGKQCPSVEPLCDEVSSFGDLVRTNCAKTCGFCLGTGTAKGGFSKRRDSILQELARLDAVSGDPKPEVEVRYVGPEEQPILIVDNFLPVSVVKRAMLAGAKSPLWQPMAKQHLDQWDQRGRHATMPKDENGLFYPKGKPAEGFPGIRAPLTNRYEELMWARLEQLRGRAPAADAVGDETSQRVLQKTKNEWVSGVTGLGLTCLSPHALERGNTIPHVDTVNSEFAILHYMSQTNWSSDPSGEVEYGGTAFYKETRTGTANFMPQHCAQLKDIGGSTFCKDSLVFRCVNLKRQPGGKMPRECDAVPKAAIDMWDLPEKTNYFLSNGDDDFELQDFVKYKFNRVVMYSPKQLHDRYMNQEAIEALSCNPEEGRITGHFFLS